MEEFVTVGVVTNTYAYNSGILTTWSDLYKKREIQPDKWRYVERVAYAMSQLCKDICLIRHTCGHNKNMPYDREYCNYLYFLDISSNSNTVPIIPSYWSYFP